MTHGERKPARPHTFDLSCSTDMLEKLKRELTRLGEASDRFDVIDHGTNAAMTAWHLTDWFWKDICRSPTLKQKVAAWAKLKIGELNKGDFVKFAKKNCPAIAYCEAIAVSTKHFGSSGTVEFDTAISENLREQPPSRKHGWVQIKDSPDGSLL